ncbi:MAG: hypothetical protein Q9160_002539 [Pyrenula sp. 1 TL-2023]
MPTVASKASSIPHFSNLPPELRNQIWRDALPGHIGSALYFYRKGCWCPRCLSESDKDYDREDDERNLNFEFCHDLLDDIQFEVSLVSVNHEARAIALTWVREEAIEIRPSEGAPHPVFVRPFDPARDVLYIAPDAWDDFLAEPDVRLLQPDLVEKLVGIESDITRIAMPMAGFGDRAARLTELFQYFFNVTVIFVVIDP